MKIQYKLILSIIFIYIAFLTITSSSYAVGTMEYSYNSNGNFNIWGEGVQTTYANAGYVTHFEVDGTETMITRGSGSLNSVSCQIILSYVSDRNYVKIEYKIKNNSTATKKVGVASHADIQIASNDFAPISNLSGNRGFTMTGDGHVFKFLGRDTYGVVNVDTYWFGQYQAHTERKWSMTTVYDYAGYGGYRPGDSGMAWSWRNRSLAPGATLDLSVLIGIGDVNNPPTIKANNFSSNQYKPGGVVQVQGTVNDINVGDIVQVRFAIDGGAESIIASGIVPNGVEKPYNTSFTVPTNIASGRHFVDLWAFDNHGNMSAVVRVYFNVVADVTAPTATHTLNPNIWTRWEVTINVVATDDVSGVKSITLPSKVVVNASTASYTVNENGTYIFKLEDNVGNVRDYPVKINNIDRIRPTLTIQNNITKWSKDSVEITYLGGDAQSGVEKIVLPNGEETTSASGSYVATQSGVYKFTVYDKAGNLKIQKATIANIDNIAPTIELEARTDWVPDKVDITWKAQDIGSGISKVKLPNDTYNASSSNTYTVTQNGEYTFTVYDNVGNETTETIEIRNIDKNAPTISTTYESKWELEELDILWEIEDNESGIREIILPNGSISENNSGQFHVVQNGTYKFIVYDNVGNVTVKEVVINNIDNKLPKIILKMNSEWTPDISEIHWEVIDAESGLREVILPNSTSSTQVEGTFTATENGKYVFLVYDNVGNIGKAEIEVNNIDKINPKIETNLSTEEWTNENIKIEWNVDDGESGIREVVKPDGKITDEKGSYHVVTENGEYSFIVYDNAGNQTIKKLFINNIDKTKPTITLSKEKLQNGQTQIKWETNDDSSGVKEIILPDSNSTKDITGTFLVDNTGTFTFIVYDKAGNYQIQSITIED